MAWHSQESPGSLRQTDRQSPQLPAQTGCSPQQDQQSRSHSQQALRGKPRGVNVLPAGGLHTFILHVSSNLVFPLIFMNFLRRHLRGLSPQVPSTAFLMPTGLCFGGSRLQADGRIDTDLPHSSQNPVTAQSVACPNRTLSTVMMWARLWIGPTRSALDSGGGEKSLFKGDFFDPATRARWLSVNL